MSSRRGTEALGTLSRGKQPRPLISLGTLTRIQYRVPSQLSRIINSLTLFRKKRTHRGERAASGASIRVPSQQSRPNSVLRPERRKYQNFLECYATDSQDGRTAADPRICPTFSITAEKSPNCCPRGFVYDTESAYTVPARTDARFRRWFALRRRQSQSAQRPNRPGHIASSLSRRRT